MKRFRIVLFTLLAAFVALCFSLLVVGSVDIPLKNVLSIVSGEMSSNEAWIFIVLVFKT